MELATHDRIGIARLNYNSNNFNADNAFWDVKLILLNEKNQIFKHKY